NEHQGSSLTVGEAITLLWTTTARLKLDNRPPVQCHLATVYFPHTVCRDWRDIPGMLTTAPSKKPTTPSFDTESLQTNQGSTVSARADILSAYAPTLCSTAEEKDHFYQALEKVIHRVPNTERLYLLGDFNGRLGADHQAWPIYLRSFGCGTINKNGLRLLELT
ncbi:hypothetical protein RRG08_058203, partial [Elysia crispata]